MPLTKVKSGGVSDSITLTSPDINAPDIDGGTIDNAVIGGSTAAAGSFTTITATGGSSSNWNTAYGWGDHSTQSYATQTYVGTEVSNLVDSSPAALDTLNELAAALGDDPNFATTVTNSIALKAPLANPSFTGSVNTEAVSTNSLDLQAIAESKSVTAVDVFVYDTSKDSDGGAWRHRTQHTSWYNETLNTSTRGATKKFPSVAVIVAENGSGGGVSIYDGDDPDLPLWMKFSNSSSGWNAGLIPLGGGTTNITAASAKNGQLSVSTTSNSLGLLVISFIEDMTRAYLSVNSYGGIDTAPLSLRNTTGHTFANNQAGGNTLPLLVNLNINDVAVTVLPNAPIDADTGLPVPTIAVATDGGVSVIKDDGTVVDIRNIQDSSTFNFCMDVHFRRDGGLVWSADSAGNVAAPRFIQVLHEIPTSDFVHTSVAASNNIDEFYSRSTTSQGDFKFLSANGVKTLQNSTGRTNVGTVDGLSSFAYNKTTPEEGLGNYITSTYNTGWMHGDIKLATLSDTDDTNVTGSELVTNGGFTNGTSSWVASQSTVSGGSNKLTLTPNSGVNGGIYQSITTVVGKSYVAQVKVLADAGSLSRLIAANSTDINTITSTNLASKMNMGTGTHSITFVATATTTTIWLVVGGGTGQATEFDDATSAILAEQDRSVTNNDVQVFGTVTKTAVATGAELVGYSGFSTSNYLQQPYNSNLGFGTGDFSFICWVKKTGTAGGYIFDRANGDGTQRVTAYFNSGASSISGYTNNGPINDVVVPNGSWFQLVQLRVNGTMKIYINGELKGSVVTATNLSGDTNVPLRIGTRFNSTDALTVGSLALFRISATAPSAEQIAKMYNDEKHLFQEGAQATLYGTSDAVTALAYDDDTELLHAGTSAGRSVFQGLRRVENTTDAVGSAISASNGLVAED